MEFGLFFLMQRDEEWSERSVYDSGLAQMLAAEALGYSSVWIAEHHFNDYGLCPAPQVLASFVAARTKTLRLGRASATPRPMDEQRPRVFTWILPSLGRTAFHSAVAPPAVVTNNSS